MGAPRLHLSDDERLAHVRAQKRARWHRWFARNQNKRREYERQRSKLRRQRRRVKQTIVCRECGAECSKTPNRRYCSKSCKYRARKLYMREWRRATIDKLRRGGLPLPSWYGRKTPENRERRRERERRQRELNRDEINRRKRERRAANLHRAREQERARRLRAKTTGYKRKRQREVESLTAQCTECAVEFSPNTTRQVYCSKRCGTRRAKRVAVARRHALEAAKPIKCSGCGTVFHRTKFRGFAPRYCSLKCLLRTPKYQAAKRDQKRRSYYRDSAVELRMQRQLQRKEQMQRAREEALRQLPEKQRRDWLRTKADPVKSAAHQLAVRRGQILELYPADIAEMVWLAYLASRKMRGKETPEKYSELMTQKWLKRANARALGVD